MASAEGQVQNLRYTATFPLLINVANQPTYFMALKDSAGLVKKFAMIDIRRYQNVAIGDTVADCQKSYEQLLATNGVDTTGGVVLDTGHASGTIVHMAQAVLDGNTHFYVRIEGDDALYDFALPGLLDIVGYGVGDRIQFNYLETDTSPVPVESIGAASSGSGSASSSSEAADDSQAAAQQGTGTVEGPESAQGRP